MTSVMPTSLEISMLVTYLVTLLVCLAIAIVTRWKIFTKAGEAGWKSIIPFLSGHINYKICWKPLFYWISFVLGFVGSLLVQFYPDNTALLVVSLILLIAGAIVGIIQCVKLSKAFGHGGGYAVGLIFLAPIFMLILAFGKSQYVGNPTKKVQ